MKDDQVIILLMISYVLVLKNFPLVISGSTDGSVLSQPPGPWSVSPATTDMVSDLSSASLLVLDREISILNICILVRFQDHENMLEETWNMDLAGGGNSMGLPVWDSFAVSPLKPKKVEKIGLAEAISSSILSAGIDML